MPTYDYKCRDCGEIFEHFQSMKDEPLKECLCGKKGKIDRMISPGSGIVFKGSGFYVTDYKKGPDKKTESSKDSGSSAEPIKTSDSNASNPTVKSSTETKV